MVNLTEKEILKLREARYHERDLQYAIMDSDRTDEEKLKTLKSRMKCIGLYWNVFNYFEELMRRRNSSYPRCPVVKNSTKLKRC